MYRLVRGTFGTSLGLLGHPTKLNLQDIQALSFRCAPGYLIAECMKSRKLKVVAFYRSLHPELKIASAIRLQGEWLRQAGFNPGDVVDVDVAPGYLTIKKKLASV